MVERRVRSAITATARTWAAVLLVAVAVVLSATPARAATPAVTVTPDTDLVDFSPVQVSGTGYDGYSRVEVYQCRGGAVDEFDCDASNAFEFDPDAPLRPPVTPSEDLRDGQTVRVSGQNLSFREETFAYVCVAEPGEPGRRCDLDRMVRGVATADGNVEIDLPVFSTFNSPLGGPRTCGPLGDECEVLVSWSFYGSPDRRAGVPIRFAVPGPDPTVTTFAPVDEPRPAAPAAPVAAQAGFTG